MMNLMIGITAGLGGLLGMARTPQLEVPTAYSAVSSDDSVVSLLQVSGKKKVGDNRSDSGATRSWVNRTATE
eukprot:symbB.v1.2.036515.t1/scaffold5178.1/size30123/1